MREECRDRFTGECSCLDYRWAYLAAYLPGFTVTWYRRDP